MKLIPYLHNRQDGSEFEPGDTRELFARNLERRPEAWPWRSRSVRYTWNSQGYRTKDWSQISWADSVVFMGCSFVTGIGVSDEDTVVSQYTQLTGSPAVNLGMGGSGAHVINWNTLCLLDYKIKPRAVVILAPEPTRLTYFSGAHVYHMLPRVPPMSPELEVLYTEWLRTLPNAEYHGIMALKGAEALWQAQGVPTVMCYRREIGPFFEKPGRVLGPRIDMARDEDPDQPGSGHNGPRTYKVWAEQIASWLPI